MTRREIHVHIDELVLHGFPAADRRPIGDAVQAALAQQIAQQVPTLLGDHAPPARLSIPRLDGGRIAGGGGARALGTRIATSVAGALGGQSPPRGRR